MPRTLKSPRTLKNKEIVLQTRRYTYQLSQSRRRWFVLLLAIGFVNTGVVSIYGQEGQRQQSELILQPSTTYSRGELPSSPWANNSSNQQSAGNVSSSVELSRRLRQPRTGGRSTGSLPSGPERLNLGPQYDVPTDRPGDDPATPEPGSARPSPVTLMGPMVPTPTIGGPNSLGKSNNRKTNRASKLSKATDSSTVPTEKLQSNQVANGSRPEWQHLQAGGLILEDPSPGLPDRNSESELESQTPSLMATTTKVHDGSSSISLTKKSTSASNEPIAPITPSSDGLTLIGDEAGSTNAKLAEPIRLDSPVETRPSVESKSSPAPKNDFLPSTTPVSLRAAESAPTLEMDESKMQRVALAQKVSYELLSRNPNQSSRAPESLEVPIGFGAVRKELEVRLERCDAYLKRGAIFCARDEVTQGLRRLCTAMDSHRRTPMSAPALESAFTALREEADFQNILGGGTPAMIAAVVGSHATEALKERPLDNVSAEIASQHYRNFARYQFVVASDGHQWAAELLYAYGKTLEKEADSDTDKAYRLRSQSVACYQAATQISPSQTEASSQLGYALINLDRIEEAEGVLTASLNRQPSASAWNNLAEIYRRRGLTADADFAIQKAAALTESRPVYTAENPEVTNVDPATFAKYSPMTLQVQGTQPVNDPSTQFGYGAREAPPAARTASSNFITKIFSK